MPFKKVKDPKKKSSYVAEQIVNAIRAGEYRVGDSLPSEREIARQMSVSRNSVREAISALQIVGVVKSKAGSGTYVASQTMRTDINRALFLAKGSQDLLQIWEARKEIEKILAKLALKRVNEQDIKELESSLRDFRKAVQEENYQAYHRANHRFHLAIADLADNLYLKRALKALLAVTREHLLKNMVEDYSLYMKRSLPIHVKIMDLIQKGEEEAIDQVVDRHFRELEEYLEERIFRD